MYCIKRKELPKEELMKKGELILDYLDSVAQTRERLREAERIAKEELESETLQGSLEDDEKGSFVHKTQLSFAQKYENSKAKDIDWDKVVN